MGRALCVVMLAVVLLAGCGGAPVPRFAPLPSASVPSDPSTTAAADPLPPVMPEAARAHTVAGAKAFVEYLVDTVDYAYASLDTKPLAALMSDYCSGCRGGVASIDKLARRNATVAGGTWRILNLQVEEMSAGSQHPMRVVLVTSSEREVVTYPNGDSNVFPGGRSKDQLTLSPESGSWVVASWQTAG